MRAGLRAVAATLLAGLGAACSTGDPASPRVPGELGVAASSSTQSTEGGASDDAATEVPGEGLPTPIAVLLQAKCVTCHSTDPVAAPMSLETYDDLMAPAVTDPSQRVADLCLVRMQSASMPMPPAGNVPATPTEIATFASWLDAGTPRAGEGGNEGEDASDERRARDGAAGDAGDGNTSTPDGAIAADAASGDGAIAADAASGDGASETDRADAAPPGDSGEAGLRD